MRQPLRRPLLLVSLLCLAGVTSSAQTPTPKAVTVSNASVTKTWTITGYEVVVPDPANPLDGSIGIRFQLVTKLGVDVLSTEPRTATCSGPANTKALLTDLDTRVRAAIAAGDTNAYFNGTRAALYAWLQANGHIDQDAK